MSGIAAYLRLDGAQVTDDVLAPALNEMRARGPDGEGILVDGGMALGHRLLASTPESVHEPMPFVHSESGCAITADIRLDNRETLIERFGLDARTRVIGDGELVLRAYLEWGEDCPNHLLGDFAFVIWDPRKRRLFGARDQIGMKQLIYTYAEGKVFACSSSARATVAAPGVERRLNELRIADALVDIEETTSAETFYEAVYRLPPAHSFGLESDGRYHQRRYWKLEPKPLVHLRSDDEYAEIFREKLTLAINRRLRSNGDVGAMLSGGMDSSAIVALTSRIYQDQGRAPLRTYSIIGPKSENLNETWATRAVIGATRVRPTLYDYASLGPWAEELLRLWQTIDEPFDLNMNVPRLAWAGARKDGVKAVLDGGGGDAILSAENQLAREMRALRFSRVIKEVRSYRQEWNVKFSDMELAKSAALAFAPRGVWPFAGWAKAKLRGSAYVDGRNFLQQDYVKAHALEARWSQLGSLRPQALQGVSEEKVSGLTGWATVNGQERYERVAAACGIDQRDPYMDLDLIDFCISLPAPQSVRLGVRKIVQRHALQGLLPDNVVWRRDKEHLGFDLTSAVLRSSNHFWEQMVSGQSQLDGRTRWKLPQEGLQAALQPEQSRNTLRVISNVMFLSGLTDLA